MAQSMVKVWFHFARDCREISSRIDGIVAGWVDGHKDVKVRDTWYSHCGAHGFQFIGEERVIQRLWQRIDGGRGHNWPITVVPPKVVDQPMWWE